MKKSLAILLVLTLSLPLAACGSTDSTPPVVSTQINLENDEPTEEKTVVEFSEPVVILDNADFKMEATAKYSKYDALMKEQTMGYEISVENKTDKYIMFVVCDSSLDGYMLELQDGPYSGANNIAPHKKANTTLYFIVSRMDTVDFETLDDLINFDGLCQIYFSDDGDWYEPVYKAPFDNIVP